MLTLIKSLYRVLKHPQGMLDTSVVIDIALIDDDDLPSEASISAVTLAELTAGPHSTNHVSERAKRLERLQWAESTFDAIPFDARAARAYGRIYAAVASTSRKPRGARAVDLLIAATALSRNLPLYTRNAPDFAGLVDLVDIVAVK